MKALCWHGKNDVRVETVPDPTLINPRDAIVRVTSTSICGSDLHLYDGFIPSMHKGDILGHEFMGEIVEVGSAVKTLKVGDRVVVPFPIACGDCFFCGRQLFSLCENSNPDTRLAEAFWGRSPCGIFGYSHMVGGYAGGQAEYVRVPFADVGPIKVPVGLRDEQVLFLSDVFPTGWMAAENCAIQPGDTVAVWGCGPVGQFAIRSALMMGAERVIAIDAVHERLALARGADGVVDIVDHSRVNVHEALTEMTGGRGPDACIDAVGMEADPHGLAGRYDDLKTRLMLQTDRAVSLRQAILACRNGGTVSVAGVYGGVIDKFPMGAIVNRSLTLKSGQTHVQRYLQRLLDLVVEGRIDPGFIVSHRMALDDAPDGYELFKRKRDGCVKIVLEP